MYNKLGFVFGEDKKMKLVVTVGGNKHVSGGRLGVKLAEVLGANGRPVMLLAQKGKIKFASGVTLKEYTPLQIKTLDKILSKEKATFVISLMNLPACEAAIKAKIPFIYVEPENFKEDKPIKNKKAVLKQAQQVIVLRPGLEPLSKKNYLGLKVQEVISPAIWVEHYNYNKPACFKKANNIVAVGPLVKESGFDTLLQTWARLAPAHKTWHLTIVGDGTSKAALTRFIAKNKLEESTEIVPETSDAYSLLRNADIFAYPAVKPAHADILLDAMASKLPCVACESAAVTALVTNGVNGVIVNAGEEEPFTIALDDLMVNWGKRVGIAIEASKLKDKYPFDAFVQAVEAVLK